MALCQKIKTFRNSKGNMMLHVVIPLLGVVKSGGLRVLVELANGLVQKGHKVTFITIGNGNFPFELRKDVAVLSLDENIKSIFSKMWKIYKHIPKDANVIISNYFMSAYLGYAASLFKNIPHIYFVQDYEADFFQSPQSISGNIKRLLAMTSYKLPSHTITISNSILQKISINSKNSVTIINDGVDTNIFKPDHYYKDGTIITIMAIARSEKRKGLSDLINTLTLLSKKGHKFTVFFATNEKNVNIEAAFDYEMHSPKSDHELAQLYNKANLFISTSYFEGFGLPPLEAMACGTAVVTTDSGGINEYAVNGENCLIVPVGDVESIFNAVNMLIKDNELRFKLIDGGIYTSSKFTWDVMVDKFEMELLKVCEKTV